MTAPVAAPPAFAFWEPYIVATAVVRARDGRSILDRTATEPERVFTADPDRIHAAVTALTADGIVVTGIGRTGIELRGDRAAFEKAFTLGPTTRTLDWDASAEQWSVAGSAVVDVAGPYAALLHRVLLRPPARPDATRSPASAKNLPRAKDFLLGEVGPTLLKAVPPRFAEAKPTFPSHGSDVIPQNQKAFAAWHANGLRGRFERLATARRGLPRVTLVVGEFDAPTTLGPCLELLAYGAVGTRTWFERLGTPATHAELDPSNARLADGYAMVARRCDGIGSAIEDLGSLINQARTGGDGDGDLDSTRAAVLDTEDGLRDSVEQLLNWYDEHAAMKQPLPDGITPVDSTTWNLRRLGEIYVPFRAGPITREQIAAAAAMLAAYPLTTTADQWSAVLRGTATALRDDSKADHVWHAAMATSCAVAVTGTAVDVALAIGNMAGQLRQLRTVMDAAPQRRYVVSTSWSQDIDNTAAAMLSYEHPVLDVMDSSPAEALLVVSAGNDDMKHPAASALRAAGTTRSFAVGGMEPVGRNWAASPKTHGYALKDTWWPGGRVSIPQVCATTWGKDGGAVLFPVPSDTPGIPLTQWGIGGGSSQSTPIVAAACAFVWAMFPELTAAQVRAAVVDTGYPLTGGSFTVAPGTGAGLVAGSEGLGNTGRVRVDLEAAVAKAQSTRPPPGNPAIGVLAPAPRTTS